MCRAALFFRAKEANKRAKTQQDQIMTETDSPPDRLSADPDSPFFSQEAMERAIDDYARALL